MAVDERGSPLSTRLLSTRPLGAVRYGRTLSRPVSVGWLISFSDMVSLLLAFFVLKFAMSEPVQPRWQALAGSVPAAAVRPGPSGEAAAPLPSGLALRDPRSPVNLDYLSTLIANQFAANPELLGVTTQRQDDRVVIALADALLFEPNRAVFTSRGERALFLLGGTLGRLGNRIEVVGHAERETLPSLSSIPASIPAGAGAGDGVGIPGPALGAWGVALARAVAVAAALRDGGYQPTLAVRAVGAADSATTGLRPRLVDIVIREQRGG
ncbi:Chemotaxis protein MotB [uncultured Gammaproteobacteria bacterium]